MNMIKTILLDDHIMFTECLALGLREYKPELSVISSVSNGEMLLEALSDRNPDLIIMDLNLPDIDGIELIPRIRKKAKGVHILVLTSYGKTKFVKEALQKGADGYLLKSTGLDSLVEAIETVLSDNTYVGEGLYITPPPNKDDDDMQEESDSGMIYEDRYMIREKLTRREREILALIAQAKNNKEIASELYISDQTVGVHRKNMMKKLGVHNTVNLVKLALEYQLVEQ